MKISEFPIPNSRFKMLVFKINGLNSSIWINERIFMNKIFNIKVSFKNQSFYKWFKRATILKIMHNKIAKMLTKSKTKLNITNEFWNSWIHHEPNLMKVQTIV
jgi:hypothetical protein